MVSAEELIALLGLQPLPQEGGYFRETYRSAVSWPVGALGPYYQGERAACTAIYYLLTPTAFSAFHRLPTDEIYHFYLGDPVYMVQLWPDGCSQEILLGTDLLAGQRPQVVVPQGVWQGSFLAPGGKVALLGTTMAPGFEFTDYEGADREWLCQHYPACADRIRQLTPPPAFPPGRTNQAFSGLPLASMFLNSKFFSAAFHWTRSMLPG